MANNEDLPVLTGFLDTDTFRFRRPSTNVDYQIAGDDLKSSIVSGADYVAVSTDKNITEGTGTAFFVTTSTDVIVITLPDPVANINSYYSISKVDNAAGCVRIDPNASEKIGGIALIFLFEENDTIVLRSNGVNWQIENTFRPYFKTGWINRSDWTNVEMGFLQVSYAVVSGTFEIGEKVTGSVSVTSGIIIDNTAGVLTIVSVSGGTNNFTSGEAITGTTSTATGTVSANTKNVDSLLLHNWGTDPFNIKAMAYFNSTASFTGALSIPQAHQSSQATNDLGCGFIGVTTNSFKYQSGAVGILGLTDSGTDTNIQSVDWYYNNKIILEAA